jgi:hypothetical protein
MNFWRILGATAVTGTAGVGIVVLSPFWGPVGAATGVAIGIAAGVGALAGGGAAVANEMMGDDIPSPQAGPTEEGPASDDVVPSPSQVRASGEEALASEKLAQMVRAAADRFQSYKKFEEFVVALAAVGFSVAADGTSVSPELQRDITEFVAGVSASALPHPVKAAIAEFAMEPPSFTAAMSFLDAIDPHHTDIKLGELVEGVIAVVAASDQKLNSKGVDWRNAWRASRAA